VKPVRILYVPQFGDSPVDPTVRASVGAGARSFANPGSVEEGKAPFAIEPLAPAWGVIGQVGLAWLLNSKPGWQGSITSALEEMAANGKARTGQEYFAALNTFKELEQSLSLFFNDYDVILTPTAAAALAGYGALSKADRWKRGRAQDPCGLHRIRQHFGLPRNQHSVRSGAQRLADRRPASRC
jgi:Asp-tRNA(Asn)/Glu-tRNA(Gln) amidotransferase A subunit family amidase